MINIWKKLLNILQLLLSSVGKPKVASGIKAGKEPSIKPYIGIIVAAAVIIAGFAFNQFLSISWLYVLPGLVIALTIIALISLGASSKTWSVVRMIVILLLVFSTIGYVMFYRTEVGVGLDIRSWFSNTWSRLVSSYKGLRRQAMGLGEWGPYVSEEEKKEPKGIKITDVQFQKPFLPGQQRVVFGEGMIYALEKPTSVQLACSIDGKEGTVDKDSLYIDEGIDTPFVIKCNLGETPKVEGVKYSKVKLSTIYNGFETDSRLKLYTLSESKLEELKGVNPFDYYEIQDETLNRQKRTTKADCGYGKTICGPLKVDMRVPALQPLFDETYTLSINVDHDQFWGGNLIEGGELSLEFLGNIKPLCDGVFELTSKDKQFFSCDFSLTGVSEDISAVEVRAKAVYDYEFSREETIVMASKEEFEA